MAINRSAKAVWEGTLKDGAGRMRLGSSVLEFPFSFGTRFENGEGTNPEELIGAAHAGCFSMAFSKVLGDAGHPPKRIQTTAKVTLDKTDAGFAITTIVLSTVCEIPGIDEAKFRTLAEQAKKGCPVSKALAGVDIQLEATLAR